jgi:hypothetical protein
MSNLYRIYPKSADEKDIAMRIIDQVQRQLVGFTALVEIGDRLDEAISITLPE